MIHNFDGDTPCYNFDTENQAKAYMHYLWEEYYNNEIAENSHLNENECFHEESYAKVAWVDGDRTEFIITFTSEPDKDFFNGDWRRYL